MAHGTPPNINSNQYDVPVPELSMLLTSGKESGERKRAAECFISLCMLSELLGEILTLVYCLKIDHREISRRLRDLETALDKWENCLPSYLKVSDHGSVDSTSVSGSCSLRTGYLSIKMLLCRVALREATHLTDIDVPEAIHYRLAKLRQAAGDIVIFICSLKEHHLKEFWLPYTAYHLASAAIILLRCAVDTKDPVISESCKTKLRLFRDQLRKAKDKNEWDLADIFLARCEEPIIRITINAPSLHQDITRELNDLSTTNVDNGLSTINTRGEQNESPWLEGSNIPDILSIPNSDAGFGQLEYPWANLWDMLDVNNNTF
ncbi:MAG: hypothetical protein M1834_008804 [Cirrosporium novae-zelandiae]|nr:MAG: hypothetical protein M1834_008804 [Cirrosporium novae-zelandiae]